MFGVFLILKISNVKNPNIIRAILRNNTRESIEKILRPTDVWRRRFDELSFSFGHFYINTTHKSR